MAIVKKSEAAGTGIEGAVESRDLMPLDFILAVMRDEYSPRSIRLKAAFAALPFCHSKLASIQPPDTGGRSHEDWVKLLAAPVPDEPDL
jgi:hypothetical protein